MKTARLRTSTKFTSAEQRLIARLRTPTSVQHWLNRLPYNKETRGDTFHSFRQVVRGRTAHCAEAALAAACARATRNTWPAPGRNRCSIAAGKSGLKYHANSCNFPLHSA